MERVAKTYRFPVEFIESLNELTRLLNVSETEAITRAVKFYIAFIKNEDDFVKQKAVVSVSEYMSMQEKMQGQIAQLLYKLGEVEGSVKEKDKTIESQQELIKQFMEYVKNHQEKDKTKDKRTSFWFFWRKL